MKNIKILVAGTLCLSMMLGGCSSNTEEKKEDVVVEDVAENKGEALLFNNSTSKTITSIKIKKTEEEKYGKNLLEEDLKDGAGIDLYPEAEADAKYDLQFEAAGTVYTVNELPLEKLSAISLFLDGDSAYVEYTDPDGNKTSTKKENKEEEQPVQEAAAIEEAPVQEYVETYVEPYYEAPAYDGGGDVSVPADDGCLTGITDADLN